jgi:hypothetical protein
MAGIFKGRTPPPDPQGKIEQTGAATGQTRAATDRLVAGQPFVASTAAANLGRVLTAGELAALNLKQAKAAAWLKSENARMDNEQAATQIDEMLAMPGLSAVVGSSWSPLRGVFGKRTVETPGATSATTTTSEEPWIPIGGTEADDFMARYKQVQGTAFMGAREGLKGAGAVTDYEGMKALQARLRMNLSTSVGEFKKAAEEYKYYMALRANKMRASYDGPEAAQTELDRRASEFRVIGSRPAED